MNLIELAVPFFIAAILVEIAYGWKRGRNTFRLNDSISSLMMGIMSQARRFVTLGVGGYFYYLISEYFSLELMDPGHWFTWVLAMVLYDFCYYWLHRLGHERTILWAAHVAHHQSEDYNLTTALRQTSTGFLLGWIFYIPMYMLGIPAEVVVTVGALNLIYQFWVHTEHVPKLGWYEWIFVTPSNHRVHHAQNDIYLDRNYGGLFIIWDRLFGTFQEELDSEPVVFGIRGAIHSWNPLKANVHIYVDMVKDCWRTQRWQDKLRVWVSRTGWRPDDVALRYPRQKTDLAHFEKFDPPIARAVGGYAFFQLLVMIALLSLAQSLEGSYRVGVLVWGFLLATGVMTASWLEHRDTARMLRWDIARLAAAALGLIVLRADIPTTLSAVSYTYLGLNLMALVYLKGRAESRALELAS